VDHDPMVPNTGRIISRFGRRRPVPPVLRSQTSTLPSSAKTTSLSGVAPNPSQTDATERAIGSWTIASMIVVALPSPRSS
jgi:hypothetical protein